MDEEERGGWFAVLDDRPLEDSSHTFSWSNALRPILWEPSSSRRRDLDACLDLDRLHFSLADISLISSRSVPLHRNLLVPLVRPFSFSWGESAPYGLGRRKRAMDPPMRSGGVRGTMLGLIDRESALSGEVFVRDLPRVNELTADRWDGSPVASGPRIESFKDESEAGMKQSLRGNPDGLLLLDEEREPRDVRPGRGDSSDMALWEWGGDSESEMTTEMVRVRVCAGTIS